MATATADCALTFEALEPAELGHLTGFTHRVAAALVHLREAWLIADDSHLPAVEEAIGLLFRSPSLARDLEAYRAILCHGLDERQAAALWGIVMQWVHAREIDGVLVPAARTSRRR